jgi:hypothetical protein
MKKWYFAHASLFFVICLFNSCGLVGRLSKLAPIELIVLDQKTLPGNIRFQDTQVGGLSGIDYDPTQDCYYIISDDRSQLQPARYYTARIQISNRSIDSIQLLRVDTLRDRQGRPYGPRSVDPEAIRFDALSGFRVWTSEGERNPSSGRMTNPSINLINQRGFQLDSIAVPEHLQVYRSERGSRDNGTLEALSFSPDYRQIWIGMEEPLIEDGSRIDTNDNSSYIRLLAFDRFSKQLRAEYAYQLETVAHAPKPANGFRINGVSEILFLDSLRLLVMERSFSTGTRSSTVRIFLASLEGATPIQSYSLKDQPEVKPLTKRLLLNTDKLGRHVDNLEGMCWGPRLPNGNRSLIIVSDDNFSNIQETQFWLMELKEK